jgi:dTDP-4-amino-4,6-dideoxygalactose transaminase
MGYADEKLPQVYDAVEHVLSLPVHPEVTEEQVGFIASELKTALKSA